MAHEPDEPAVNSLASITVIGTMVALVLAFMAAAVSNQMVKGIPDTYQRSSAE
jgi:hypothetical protein